MMKQGLCMPLSVNKCWLGKFGWQNLVRLLILTLIAFQGKAGHSDCVYSIVRGLTMKTVDPRRVAYWVPPQVLLRTLPVGLRKRQTTFTTMSGDMTMVNIKGHLPQIEVLSNDVLRPRLKAQRLPTLRANCGRPFCNKHVVPKALCWVTARSSSRKSAISCRGRYKLISLRFLNC